MNPIGKKISLAGQSARLLRCGEEQDAGVRIARDLRPDSDTGTELKSEKGAFFLKTSQFEFAEPTRPNEFSQPRVRRFAQAARFA